MYFPGAILLWAATFFAVLSTVTYVAALRDEQRFLELARRAYGLMVATVVGTTAVLLYLLIRHDYRLVYVTAYSDDSLPLHFLISSLWAGQEGSFLLWLLWGAILGVPLIKYARHYETRVMLFYNLTLLSLLAILVKQNPFRFHAGLTAATVPLDGSGLNPLLQNFWMVIHPPIMFIGYASLAIPFAFALAALWMRTYDEWVKASLPWVLLSVLTLGLAIMLGGYWAYETLGWGGYWGWDPVENASLVPWLTTVALAHGMLLQRGRNRFRRLNLVLAVASYLLVVYATFLTRSGVLADFSVHSFVDLGITGWLVVNMVGFLVLAIALLLWRWREIPAEVGDEPFLSRTVFLVLGILQLVLIAAVVVVGTSAPLITRLWGNPSQVGPDFYNRMGFWLAVLFALILGATPFLGWRQAREGSRRRLAGVVVVTAVLLAAAVALGVRDATSFAYIGAVLFCLTASTWAMVERLAEGKWRAAGGLLSHVGMAMMMLAFITTGWFGEGTKVRLFEGQPTAALGYTLTFRGVEKPTPQSRDAMVVEVTPANGRSYLLKPKMWVNQKSDQMVANPDIKVGLTRDLYLAPAEYTPPEAPSDGGVVVLRRGEGQPFRDLTLTLEGWQMAGAHDGSGMSVSFQVAVERAGSERTVVAPAIVSRPDGGLDKVAVAVPGAAGGQLRVLAMDVGSGQVQAELTGFGGAVGHSAVLHRNETFTYRDLTITFSDFDMSAFDPDGGVIEFGVILNVVRGERRDLVVPWFRGGAGSPTVVPAEVPDSGGLTLSIGRVDAEGGAVEVRVFDPALTAPATQPASLVVDVSTKPLIMLVWLGTILVVLGTGVAIALRLGEIPNLREAPVTAPAEGGGALPLAARAGDVGADGCRVSG